MATLPMQTGDVIAAREARSELWAGVPWFCWTSALAVSCAVFGLHFDIAWHRSIGRDSFWNPAHQVLYSSGILTAIPCAYLIFATTFGHDAAKRRHSVQIWGLRAPFGVFVAAWGGLGILYDAVFDNWWHNAYGLDVRFTSPPHLLFSISLWFEMLGALLLTLSYLNRAERETLTGLNAGRLKGIVLYIGSLMATAQLFACFSYTWDTKLHSSKAYLAVAIFLPVLLALVSQVTQAKWACTVMASVYSGIIIGLILVLPLFAATPRLGPIYVAVTHFIPPRFPLLVIVPAVALDLLWTQRLAGVWRAMLSGILFVGLLVAVEWPFADFLVSPASANRFFGTRYLGFDDLVGPPDASLWMFQEPQHGLKLMVGLGVAAGVAAAGMWIGSAVGRRLEMVRR